MASRVAVIGAGAAGLAAARALRAAGIPHVTVFEQRSGVAGLWRGARDGEAACVARPKFWQQIVNNDTALPLWTPHCRAQCPAI